MKLDLLSNCLKVHNNQFLYFVNTAGKFYFKDYNRFIENFTATWCMKSL